MSDDVRYPDVTVQLTGEDGNVFAIVGRSAHEFQREALGQHAYDDVLQVVMSSVEVD